MKMKKLYLASSIDQTAESIAKDIGKDPKKLKLAFISTAAEVDRGDKNWLDKDRNGLIKVGFNLFDYTITDKNSKQIEKDLKDADVIHVNGGNSFYLLLQIRKSGFDKFIKKQIDKGEIYMGSSAGSMVASPNIEIAKRIETGDYEKKLKSFEAMKLVDFITFPHWGSDHFRDVYFNKQLDVAYKPENKIILLNNYQYVKVEKDMYRIIDVRD